MILDRHYIQDHSHKLLNVHPSMCLHTLPELPLLPQFRILFFSKSEMAHIEPLLELSASSISLALASSSTSSSGRHCQRHPQGPQCCVKWQRRRLDKECASLRVLNTSESDALKTPCRGISETCLSCEIFLKLQIS